MEKLYIEETKGTPKVDFDSHTNVLVLKGQSYPENAFKFYEPIFQWLDQYLEEADDEVLVEFTLPYINTSSSKCMMMLLEKLEDAYNAGKRITINWYYDQENESELECAEEFQEDVTMPFNLIPMEDQDEEA